MFTRRVDASANCSAGREFESSSAACTSARREVSSENDVGNAACKSCGKGGTRAITTPCGLPRGNSGCSGRGILLQILLRGARVNSSSGVQELLGGKFQAENDAIDAVQGQRREPNSGSTLREGKFQMESARMLSSLPRRIL